LNIGDEKITSLAGCMFSRVFLCVDIGVFRKADFNLFKRTIESFALYFVICMILSDITIYCILLCWSVFENSFPPTARPTLRYIWPSFGQRSPLRLPHSGQISHIILDISSPRSLNCDAHLTESIFQTRSSSQSLLK